MISRLLTCFISATLVGLNATALAESSNHPLTAAADALTGDQTQWLSADGQQFLALYTKERSGSARGGVVMVTTAPRSPSESAALLNLHHTLPDRNWHSLLVSPVSPAPTATSNIPDTEAQVETKEATAPAANQQAPADSAANDTPPAQPAPSIIISSSVKSGVAFLNQQGIFNMVLIGEGDSAVRVMHYIANLSGEQAKQIRGAVLLNPRNQLGDHQLPGMIAALKIPVLDIYNNLDYRDREEALKRQQQSQTLAAGQYTQVELPRISTIAEGENLISRRIRGWLNKTASGFEVKTRR
jgi:hypothetical protein